MRWGEGGKPSAPFLKGTEQTNLKIWADTGKSPEVFQIYSLSVDKILISAGTTGTVIESKRASYQTSQ